MATARYVGRHVALLALATTACTAQHFDQTSPRAGVADAAGVTSVRIIAGAGWLRIEGRSGATQVRATGIAHASSQELLRRIQLTVTRAGDVVTVVATVPPDVQSIGQAAALDLTIELPPTLALDVADGSGETIVRNVGALTIANTSGNVEIDGVAGPLDLRDGAGDLQAADIRGDVHVIDGGGAMYISNVHGSVRIPVDGAGEVQVAGVSGDLLIGRKQSGEVSVRDVGGDFIVDASGSGSIQYHGVRGHVSVAGRAR